MNIDTFVTATVPILVIFAIWFIPVAIVYKAAEAGRKNTDHVLIAGIFLGWIGAAIVALILPRMDEAAWVEFKERQQRKKRKTASQSAASSRPPMEWNQQTILFAAMGVMAVLCVGFIAFLKMI
jgi:hypothetical protein